MGSVDDSKVAAWNESQRRQAELRGQPELPLSGGGGGGTYIPMESRVSRLETHMEYVRRDLDSIEGKLDKLIEQTQHSPTKADLWAWKWQWTALAFAVVAIVIGGIIGGLAYIQPAPSAPAPIVVSLPK